VTKSALPLLLLAAAIPAAAEQKPMMPDVAEARALVQQFGGTLKGELQAAMKSGGPTAAIEVCHTRAPEIAADLSTGGWEVARTSMKPRNPDNAPDAWETQIMEQFEAQKAEGKPVQTLEYSEVVTTENGTEFRYMKAIPTQGVCLTCHGTDIQAPVKAKLDALYPEDKARGYAEGDIRGAFTLRHSM